MMTFCFGLHISRNRAHLHLLKNKHINSYLEIPNVFELINDNEKVDAAEIIALLHPFIQKLYKGNVHYAELHMHQFLKCL